MIINEERTWAGSESSLQAAIDAEKAVTARMSAGPYEEEEEDEGPRLLEVSDGIATIAIKGSLVNSDSPYLQYFGCTGYPEIRDAMIAAANDPEVTQILLDIDSGGGAVSGVDDTAKLIRLVNDQVKPVTTYTDGNMCSAAYWLGSSAGEVVSSKSSLVGSIGVIATHKEYSEAYKKEGVGVTVVRAGKHKALANSNEKLTAEGKAQIQMIVDAAYEVFVDHVSAMRGKSYEYADKTMADGQEFIGQAAVDVGLTDRLATFDSLLSDLKGKSLAQLNKPMDNHRIDSKKLSGARTVELSGEVDMAKKALTEADIAALAAGATAQAASGTTIENVEPVVPPTEPAAVTDPVVDPAAAEVPEVAKSDATVQLLTAQLKEKDGEILQAGIKLAKLEDQIGEMTATNTPLLEIAAQSISNMSIALGGSAYQISGMSPVQVLAEHQRVSAQFKSKFQVGGVAAVSADAPADKNGTVKVTAITQARFNAVQFSR